MKLRTVICGIFEIFTVLKESKSRYTLQKTIVEKLRAMLIEVKIPKHLWNKVALATIYLLDEKESNQRGVRLEGSCGNVDWPQAGREQITCVRM